MAVKKLVKEDPKGGGANSDEAKELQRLLEEQEQAEKAAQSVAGRIKEFRGLVKRKKKLFIISGLFLVLIVSAGVGLYFKYLSAKRQLLNTKFEQKEKTARIQQKRDQALSPHIYKLQPFFLPIMASGKESGKFVSVTINLSLSNQKLDREIDKVLPLIRKNVYAILNRKSQADFKSEKKQIEERIRREILTDANTLLLRGTGTITGVFFEEFVVR